MRELKYWQALSEGLVQAMEADGSVFAMGVGVDDPKGIFGTILEARRRFGSQRVFDIPLSENAITGVAIGASLSGMRPVMVHARNDFMLLTMDQLINNAAKWRYVSGGSSCVPIVIRAIIGRGWGQGSQHWAARSKVRRRPPCRAPRRRARRSASHDNRPLRSSLLRRHPRRRPPGPRPWRRKPV